MYDCVLIAVLSRGGFFGDFVSPDFFEIWCAVGRNLVPGSVRVVG